MHPEKSSIRKKLEEKIRITPGCWMWTGFKNKDGYGMLNVDRRSRMAHRLSYEIYVAPIPEGLLVCHKCDNPTCVNPDHLWAGTNKQNSDDKIQKGRWSSGPPRSGELHPLAKLTDADIYSIRSDKRLIIDIAKEYNVSSSVISAIKLRRSWSHLPKRDDEIGRKKHEGSGKKKPILTDEQQLAILADPRTQVVIGYEYGVSQAVISKIKLGKGCYAKHSKRIIP